MPPQLDDDCLPLPIEPGNIVDLDAWLVDVRRLVPLAQPTAYRLARRLLHTPSSRICLTEDVQSGLGRVVQEWEDDLADLYRSGLLAMWTSLRSPTVVMLLRAQPASE